MKRHTTRKSVRIAVAFLAVMGVGATLAPTDVHAQAMGEVGQAGVTLPPVFADGMVIQKDAPVRVWGVTAPGEFVFVRLIGTSEVFSERRNRMVQSEVYNEGNGIQADSDGNWMLELPASDVAGDFEMLVTLGQENLLFAGIAMGDVHTIAEGEEAPSAEGGELRTFDGEAWSTTAEASEEDAGVTGIVMLGDADAWVHMPCTVEDAE